MFDPKKIRIALIERDMTQAQLAGRLLITAPALSEYLSGKRVPAPDFQQSVEQTLDLQPGALALT